MTVPGTNLLKPESSIEQNVKNGNLAYCGNKYLVVAISNLSSILIEMLIITFW